MNLGIYVDTIQKGPDTFCIIDQLNKGMESGKLDDASLFFDAVAFNDLPMKFGMFNATAMWAFTGTLLTTSIDTTSKALEIVNKLKVYYYHGWEENPNIFGLISLAKNPNIKTICRNGEDAMEFKRVTGESPVGLVDNFSLEEILQQV